MEDKDARSTLEELHYALRPDVPDGKQRLRALRELALRNGDAKLAALALYGLARKETDLLRRARIQLRLVGEAPSGLAYQALADTEAALGQWHEASEHGKEALKLARSAVARRAIRDELHELNLAISGNEKASERLRLRRFQAEREQATALAKVQPKAAIARIRRQRRLAVTSGENEAASRLLETLIDLYRQQKKDSVALKLAKSLVAELYEPWTLEKLGDMSWYAKNHESAADAYSQALALATDRQSFDEAKRLENKLRLLQQSRGKTFSDR